MIIGVPRELMNREARVGITPAGVNDLKRRGHEVLVETGAGQKAGFKDEDYIREGATILEDVAEVWNRSDMIVKIKEPLQSEYQYLRKDLIVFAYLHLAANEELLDVFLENGTVAIGYETVERVDGSLPLLNPMSEVAGRMSIQRGTYYLETINGGKGRLLDGVPGVAPAHIVIVGAGTVGIGAIRRATGMEARVSVLDVNLDTLKRLSEIFMGKIETLYSNSYNLEKAIETADLVISSVLIPGEKAPKIITEDMVKSMEEGSVIIDVAIDQGGSVETIEKATSHDEPVFKKHGVIHYAVPNIPGAVASTSTLALTNATLKYVLDIAQKGWKEAAKEDIAMGRGVNVAQGQIVHPGLARTFNRSYRPLKELV